jgi:serine/threonine protein kinase
MKATAKPIAARSARGGHRIGDRIEKYEFVQSIARGGMGSVWAAKLHGPHGFGKIVAIKTVLPELAGDEDVRAMFLDEARLASAIDHRNVARVVDFLEHQGALYIVMEWIDGVSLMTLHDRMAALGKRIPVRIALRILSDVCAGLHAAHELRYANGESCGLVHRDVGPHNVLVATEGSAKLIDFGVAKARFRVAPDSTIGQLRGRLDFMAPEQAQSSPLDRRADVWSVGASLFYLLAGQGPLGRFERKETLRRLLAGARPMPPPPNTHPAVASVLAGCLAQRREDRFPTAEHLGWAIEEAIERVGTVTAGDVAQFLVDRGFRPDPTLVQTGRCAIPRDLTLLRPDTGSGIRPVGKRSVSRASKVRWGLAALACVSGIGLASTRPGGLFGATAHEAPVAKVASGVGDGRAAAHAQDVTGLPAVVPPRSEAHDSHPPGSRSTRAPRHERPKKRTSP